MRPGAKILYNYSIDKFQDRRLEIKAPCRYILHIVKAVSARNHTYISEHMRTKAYRDRFSIQTQAINYHTEIRLTEINDQEDCMRIRHNGANSVIPQVLN